MAKTIILFVAPQHLQISRKPCLKKSLYYKEQQEILFTVKIAIKKLPTLL